jgi:hypothetical protein
MSHLLHVHSSSSSLSLAQYFNPIVYTIIWRNLIKGGRKREWHKQGKKKKKKKKSSKNFVEEEEPTLWRLCGR